MAEQKEDTGRLLRTGINKKVDDGLAEALREYNLKEGLILTFDKEDEFVLDGKKIIVKPV